MPLASQRGVPYCRDFCDAATPLTGMVCNVLGAVVVGAYKCVSCRLRLWWWRRLMAATWFPPGSHRIPFRGLTLSRSGGDCVSGNGPQSSLTPSDLSCQRGTGAAMFRVGARVDGPAGWRRGEEWREERHERCERGEERRQERRYSNRSPADRPAMSYPESDHCADVLERQRRATWRGARNMGVNLCCRFQIGPRPILVAAMRQITDWPHKLGIPEYAERFAENDIDMAVVPDLTDQPLKDLGVSLGHRLKMRRAMRDLGNPLVVAAAPSAPAATEPTRTRGPRRVRRYRSTLTIPWRSKVLHGRETKRG
jgi:SAM domain (Sterile alpha motif)